MILKILFCCYIVLSGTPREVLQELRVLHVTSSRNGRYRPKLEVGLRQQSANCGLSLGAAIHNPKLPLAKSNPVTIHGNSLPAISRLGGKIG